MVAVLIGLNFDYNIAACYNGNTQSIQTFIGTNKKVDGIRAPKTLKNQILHRLPSNAKHQKNGGLPPLACTPHFQPQLIRNHGDKLRISRLASGIMNGVPKVRIEHIYIASVPCHLNGMADGTFHSGGGGLISLGNGGVKLLGHRIDDLRRFDGH